MYATGEAVALDLIEAHKWFIISGEAGFEAGRSNSVRSDAQLGLMQVAEAKRRAKEWTKRTPRA
jgi:TPR repeat protein